MQSHGVALHFQETEGLQELSDKNDRYTGAYFYAVKGNDFVTSANHPQMRKAGKAPADRRMTNSEYVDLITQKGITDMIDVYVLANNNAKAGNRRLKDFICQNEARAVQLITTAWNIEHAPMKKARLEKSRMDILRECLREACTCQSPNHWHQLALQTLAQNQIPVDRYTQAVTYALNWGRGKYRNVIHVGPQSSAKTFLLKPLRIIYDAFENPSHATFNWFHAADKEIIILNDFRWCQTVMPWEQLLQLLEGDTVNFAAPKNWSSSDVTFTKDTPIFATSISEVTSKKTGEEGVRENAMMAVRWKVFRFTHSIKESNVVECDPCKCCYAHFISCDIPYELMHGVNFNL